MADNQKKQPAYQTQIILSSPGARKYFKKTLSQVEIVDVLSDLKHRVFPRPFERLYAGARQKDLVGIEIGVAGGEHSKSLLETLDIKKLYCIDPYTLYSDYHEGKAHYGVDQISLDQTELHAHRLLDCYQDTITWIRKLSSDAVQSIAGQVDFVYIDGHHDEKYVREDLINYYPKVKSGGVMGGHDFYNGFQRAHDGVVSAVIDFCTKNGLNLQVELPDWWIVKP